MRSAPLPPHAQEITTLLATARVRPSRHQQRSSTAVTRPSPRRGSPGPSAPDSPPCWYSSIEVLHQHLGGTRVNALDIIHEVARAVAPTLRGRVDVGIAGAQPRCTWAVGCGRERGGEGACQCEVRLATQPSTIQATARAAFATRASHAEGRPGGGTWTGTVRVGYERKRTFSSMRTSHAS